MWLLGLLLVLSSVAIGVQAHGDEPAAAVAGAQAAVPGNEAYIQKHMANEHHINAFDLGSFFTLHDLNRDGVWDRSEIEAIYGVHHSTSIKHSPTAEVHDEKANKIVKEVLKRLDLDGDALVSKSEFLHGGVDALPTFEEYGIGVLGHHYDAESEFFVHHEEKYHNTPETQSDEAYTHPEDVEHFQAHQRIEDEEENRERKAEGMPSLEEEAKLAAEAQAKGENYVSEFEQSLQQKRPEDKEFHQVEQDGYFGGYAQEEAESTQHVFRTPDGPHVVKTHAATNASHAGNVEERLPGETDEGFEQRKQLYAQRQQAAAYFEKLEKEQKEHQKGGDEQRPQSVKVTQEPEEKEEDFLRRVNKAKWDAARPGKAPSRPKEDVDRMRKGPPNKVCGDLFLSFPLSLRLPVRLPVPVPTFLLSSNAQCAVLLTRNSPVPTHWPKTKPPQEGLLLWRVLSFAPACQSA